MKIVRYFEVILMLLWELVHIFRNWNGYNQRRMSRVSHVNTTNSPVIEHHLDSFLGKYCIIEILSKDFFNAAIYLILRNIMESGMSIVTFFERKINDYYNSVLQDHKIVIKVFYIIIQF